MASCGGLDNKHPTPHPGTENKEKSTGQASVSGFDDISKQLQQRRDEHLYRSRRVVGSRQGRLLRVNNKELVSFCSNDYLGLAGDERIAAALSEAAQFWGVGSGASHLVCGHTDAHHQLEEELAAFTGRSRALLFSSGYTANLGVINGLTGAGDFVFEDKLNHASLLDGGMLSRATLQRFRHKDYQHLADLLDKAANSEARKLLITDGVFSMDGDRCETAILADLARQHRAWLMVDDAHGIGVLGATGTGSVDPALYNEDDVQILMGTLGKAFGTQGAFVAGSDDLIETLIQEARTFIYTTAMPAAIAAATSASLAIVREETWRREHLNDLIAQFRDGAEAQGLELLPSVTPVQPLLLGDEELALKVAEILELSGFMITAIRPPTVPRGTARLRMTLTAQHTGDDVTALLAALERALNEAGA